MVKSVNILFDDIDFDRLEKLKDEKQLSWRDLMLTVLEND